MKMSKILGILALTFVLVFSLAACGGGDNKSNGNGNGNGNGNTSTPPANTGGNDGGKDDGGKDSGKKIELSFMTLGGNNYEELAAEWNAANPNVQVTIQNTGDQTAHHNSLMTALSANSGAPDLFHMEIAFIDQFLAHEDKFHNLNDLGAQNVKDLYLDWKWAQASSVDGSFQIGLPTDVGPTTVFYRADLVEAVGLPSDPDGFSAAIDTWDKFAQVAKNYKDQTGKAFADTTDLVFNALRDQADGVIFYGTDGNFIGDTNPQVRAAYDFTVRGIQEGWITKSPMWSPEWYEDMNSGEFAVSLSPAWMVNVFKENAPDTAGKWMIAQMPEGAGNWGGSFITLPKEGKHPEEAYAFAEWLVSKESQLKSFKTSGMFPSIPELFSDPSLLEYTDEFFSNQQTGIAFGKAAERVSPVHYGPLHDATDSHFKNALRNVIEGGADPEKEWQYVIEESKKLSAR